MSRLPLLESSPWNEPQVEAFLHDFVAPLRLAVESESGPRLCSLWYEYADGQLLCATRRQSQVARLLAADPRCAFELSPNEPPYYGVRGQGEARLSRDGAEALLGRLIDRYLGDRESSLARWLLGRSADEVVVAIRPRWISCWDYRARMPASAPEGAPDAQ